MAQQATDPRTIITPDAFEVSPELLGLPLAAPLRRGLATLVDLVLIGLVTLATRDMGVIVGVVIAVLFVGVALRTPVTRDLPAPLAWGFRLSVGCLGFLILLVSTATFWWLRAGPDLADLPIDVDGVEVEGLPVDLGEAVAGIRGGVALTRATDPDEARTAALDMARTGVASGMERDELEDLIRGLMPDDQPWSDRSDEIVADVIETALLEAGRSEDAPADVELAPDAALVEYARLLEARRARPADAPDPDPDTVAARMAELRSLALPTLAADTLARLQDEVADLERANSRTQEQLTQARARVTELEEGSGLVRLMGQLVDQLGLAFGWGSVYFALLLPWWKGQTPGKRLLGVRVLRLSGEPINWWIAFERAGGYAAGFATGLLGFAQVYWDRNRQGIHDKIAGTVVIRDGVPRTPGAWQGAVASDGTGREST